jgi:hypothetical protein
MQGKWILSKRLAWPAFAHAREGDDGHGTPHDAVCGATIVADPRECFT